MTSRHLLATTVTLALANVGLNAQAPRIADSAGVRIVENPARLTFPVNLKIGGRPILDVGGLHEDQPNEEFNANQGFLRGVRLTDGGLVVIDVNRVKYFDVAGRLLKVAGRDGDGPGEFRSLEAICQTKGDTIVVADRTRLGVLDKQGHFVRHLPRTPGSLPVDGCFADGTLLLTSTTYRVPTPATNTVHLWRVRLDGTLVASLGDMIVGIVDRITQVENTWAAVDSRLVVGDGMRSDIRIFQLRSLASIAMAAPSESVAPMRLVVSIRSADPIANLSDAEVEQRKALTIPSTVSTAERAARMDRMKGMPHAATWPTIGQVYGDPDGNIWVADYLRTYLSPTGYSKFAADGRLIGRLVIPAGSETNRIQVIGFGRQNILVRRWDDDGATHLTVYPIVSAQ